MLVAGSATGFFVGPDGGVGSVGGTDCILYIESNQLLGTVTFKLLLCLLHYEQYWTVKPNKQNFQTYLL